MDVLTVQQRSRCMARIRSKNTKPELALRKAVWATGLRYRLHCSPPGKPDLVFPKAKVAVFVDGCFWHGCPQHGTKPKSNVGFWAEKLKRNKLRDKSVRKALKKEGWLVLRYWEHEIKQDIASIVLAISEATHLPANHG